MAIRQTSSITRPSFVRLLSGAALVLAAAPAMASEFAAEIELSTLNGATGFRINGGTASIGAGESVKAAGDVNGDGLADVIIGAPFTANGSAYVVLGATAGTAIDLDATALDGNNGFRIDGEASGDQLGESVSGAGDVNGDGYDDVIVGATSADVDAGAGYVVFGGPNGSIGSSLSLSAMTAAQGFKITVPGPGAEIGRDVSGVGDVNGDGFDDVAVSDNSGDTSFSNAGTIYVIFGGASPSNINLSSINASNGMRIEGPQISAFGADSIAAAGDVNGDGIDDLILGIDDVDIPVSNAGASYLVFGASPPPSLINLSAPDGVTSFRLTGEENSDDGGHSVSGAGDVNGDGYDDVIISAHDASPNGAISTGAAYVVFGRPAFSGSSLNLSVLSGSDGFRLAGEADNDDTGYSVSGAGDVNGDGFNDVMVGARRADTAEVDAGASYVVFGKSASFASSINLASLNGTDGFALIGELDADAAPGLASFAWNVGCGCWRCRQ